MYIVKPSWEILDGPVDVKLIEIAGRTCYKSSSALTQETAKRFVVGLTRSGHLSVLEHCKATVRFICDRGVSHELVRHRLASYSQESTRYCSYKGGVTFVAPSSMSWVSDKLNGRYTLWWWLRTMFSRRPRPVEKLWITGMMISEWVYVTMLRFGATPQVARSVLPNSVKTEVIMTANFTEWRHVFNVRALGTTGRPHPDMSYLMRPLLAKFARRWPAVFGDLAEKLES